MPNGGMKPCCWVCHWGTSRDTEESCVICERHHLTTYLPLATFCCDLTLQNGDSPQRYFSGDKFSPDPDTMYEWLVVAYRDSKYPGIPQYYHEPVGLAPLSVFSAWSKEQQVTVSQTHHEQKRQELTKSD